MSKLAKFGYGLLVAGGVATVIFWWTIIRIFDPRW